MYRSANVGRHPALAHDVAHRLKWLGVHPALRTARAWGNHELRALRHPFMRWRKVLMCSGANNGSARAYRPAAGAFHNGRARC